MSIKTRIEKVEQQVKPVKPIKVTDFSDTTTEELKALMCAIDNGTYELPEMQAILNKIKWGSDVLCFMGN